MKNPAALLTEVTVVMLPAVKSPGPSAVSVTLYVPLLRLSNGSSSWTLTSGKFFAPAMKLPLGCWVKTILVAGAPLMVKPDEVDDIAAQMLARDLAKQFEEELTYPGQIKVTVIRESRATEVAR